MAGISLKSRYWWGRREPILSDPMREKRRNEDRVRTACGPYGSHGPHTGRMGHIRIAWGEMARIQYTFLNDASGHVFLNARDRRRTSYAHSGRDV